MAFTYDVSTVEGKVRLLIPDNTEPEHAFEDAEIEAFLGMQSVTATEVQRIKLAAAQALETIAADHALTLKVIRILDLSTDGAKTADALMRRAAVLRRQVADGDESDDSAFEIAEVAAGVFGRRQRMTNEILRNRG